MKKSDIIFLVLIALCGLTLWMFSNVITQLATQIVIMFGIFMQYFSYKSEKSNGYNFWLIFGVLLTIMTICNIAFIFI